MKCTHTHTFQPLEASGSWRTEGLRLPSNSKSSRCEKEAFVRGFSQIARGEGMKTKLWCEASFTFRESTMSTLALASLCLLYAALLYSTFTLLYSALLYSALLYSTLRCSTLLYSTLLCSTLLYYPILHDTTHSNWTQKSLLCTPHYTTHANWTQWSLFCDDVKVRNSEFPLPLINGHFQQPCQITREYLAAFSDCKITVVPLNCILRRSCNVVVQCPVQKHTGQ